MKRQKGFTLIEILIALTITAFLALGIGSIFSGISLVNIKANEGIRLQRASEGFVGSMIGGENWGTEGLLGAKSIDVVNVSDITFKDKDGTVIKFYLLSNDVYKQIGANPAVNLDLNDLVDVLNLNFTYYNADENVETDPAKVTRIGISLTVQSKSRGSGAKYSIVSSIRPRNLWSF